MLHAFLQLRLEFNKCEEQINTQGNPDLGHYCILTGSDEGLYFQVLLDLFEKQLYLPSCLVDIGNCLGGQFEIVGQKHIVLAGFRITITDTTQLNGAFLCRQSTGEFDALIAGQPGVCQDRSATDNTGFRIGFKPGNKEYSFLCQLVIPGIIVIAPVDGHHAAFGEFQCATRLNITGLAVSDGDELG